MITSAKKSIIDWQAIALEYIYGTATIADLAVKFGVKAPTIHKRAEREDWNNKRVAESQKTFASAAKEISKRRVDDLTNFNADDLKVARALRARVARRLSKTTADGKEIEITSSELRMLASAAEAAQRMGRLALGASTDNVGHSGPGGEGPVAVENVTTEAYLKARQAVLADF